MPLQKMAVIQTVGDPNDQADAMSALYGSVYTLKFALKKAGHEFTVGALRARWPNAHLAPRDEWIGIWGIPVPADTDELPQKVPAVTVRLETWEYGTVAQILHLGPYSAEGPSIQRLHDFIGTSGYEIAGMHEEEYLTSPKAKVQKTLIRYPVRKVELPVVAPRTEVVAV
jgi:hypothetical protein